MSKKFSYIPTHVHTGHSYLDGGIKNEEYAEFLFLNKIPGGACTDHGNIANARKFHNCFSNYGLKPIIGIEAYFTKNLQLRDSAVDRDKNEKFAHQIIIAKNIHGFKNLMKHSSVAFLDYRYKKPLLSLDYFKKIDESERDGLIITSACLSNYIAQYLINDEYENAKNTALEYKEVFGEDFYLEVHPNMIDVQAKVNNGILKIAKETGITPIVVTDSHYLCCEHAQSHDVLLAIQTNKDLVDENRFRFNGSDFFLQYDEDMYGILKSHGIDEKDIYMLQKNTWEVYEKVELIKELSDSADKIIPIFDVAKQSDYNKFLKFLNVNKKYDINTDYLRFKIKEGINEKFGNKSLDKEYIERINFEIKVLQQFNLVNYFLVVSDYCSWARTKNILVGFGRGSSAGSLINFILGITNINPIKHRLVFERFLNPGRMETGEFPDIDCDFQHDRRNEVINYLVDRYGKNAVSYIGTETVMTPKLAFKDTCRVMQIDFKASMSLTKDIPSDIEAKDIKNIPSIANAASKSPAISDVLRHVEFLSGLPKNTGVHASGVIITDKEIWNYVPVKHASKTTDGCDIVTQYDMKDCEKSGLIKFDILGITNLTVISNILKKLESLGIKEDFYNLDFNIKDVYSMICTGHTVGVFQIETPLNTSITKKFLPLNIDDISVIISICRPGSLKIVDDYIDVRFGNKEPQYIDSRLEPILKETNGYLIYQEQAMEIVKELAGFTYAEADILRRAIGKKEAETMDKVRELFFEKFIGDKSIAKNIFSFIEMSQDYSFNKAHAMSYAYLAYATAYFKYKYPALFYSELINEYSSEKDKVQNIVDEAIERGVSILPPKLGTSSSYTFAEDNKIYIGFNLLKGVGDSAIKKLNNAKLLFDEIEEYTQHKGIMFIQKCIESSVPSNTITSLIKVGSLSEFGLNIPQFIDAHAKLAEYFSKLKKLTPILKRSGEVNPKWDEANNNYLSYAPIEFIELTNDDKRKCEKEMLEFSISENPLKRREEEIKAQTDELDIHNLEAGEELKIVAEISDVKVVNTKKDNKEMAFGMLKTLTTKIKFVIFPRQYSGMAGLIKDGNHLLISGRINDDTYGKQVVIQNAKKFTI